MTRSLIAFAVVLVVLGAMTACEMGPRSGAGLRMPDGDVVRGKQAFKNLGCSECHSIAGEMDSAAGSQQSPIVVLGGKVAHIETQGELVTSIINPSHGISRKYKREDVTEDGRSKMTDFNRRMTVEQLIDLTEYLQAKYELSPYEIYGN